MLYAAISPFMYILTGKLPKRMVIIIGVFLLIGGMTMIGNSDFLGLEYDADEVLVGLCMVGLAASMIAIPEMPECLEAIE